MRSLPIRWKLTLWSGAALGSILALVSLAAYGLYRASAWREFDASLVGSLDDVQGALREEIGEELRDAPDALSPDQAMALLTRASRSTLEEFRLSGKQAEIRGGERAESRLASTEGLGSTEPLFGGGGWASLARDGRARVSTIDPDRHAAARSFRPAGGLPPLTLVIVARTAGVREALASIRAALLEIGAAGLALAILGGYWLATRVLRPIAALTTQASRMAESAAPSPPRGLDIADPDDELGRLASTFNRLLERREAAVAQLKSFVADSAHELKTPIAIVRAEAELTLSTPRTGEEYRESLRTIAGESERLSLVVGDLTLLAEGQTLAHPLERRLVDLGELVQDVHRSLRPVAARREVSVELETSGCVEYRGDERLLRHTFTNLAENAVKYSRPGGRVGIGVSAGPGGPRVYFVDDAPTLSAEDRGRVFERFYRAAEAHGETAGSGLGLAIVDWAVRLHGGRVRVEPRSPSGNVFVVELPAPEAAPS